MPLWINNKRKKEITITFTDNTLVLTDDEGKETVFFLMLFPKLQEATESQRANWKIVGENESIYWEDVDESISLEGLLG